MSEASARHKFSCPACGAEATWNPAKKALVCSYCGTTSPADIELSSAGEEIIREHDLLAALRSLPDSARGWQAAKTEVRCQSCQAISVFDAARVGQNCDFCGSTALVPYSEIKDSIRPESLLEFRISETQVRETIRRWYGSHWFAPNALKTRAMTDTLHGLYIPYWTFDADVNAEWTAESGDYYYVTEAYTDSKGMRRTRQVRKIRWRPSAGSLRHVFDDTLVAASRGIDPELLSQVEPFATRELKPYHAGFLSGWVVERYQIDLGNAAHLARQKMDAELHQRCAAQVPGDTHRNLSVRADYTGQTFKHILVPVWLLTYTFRRKTYHVLINGHSGAIAGRYPKSWFKITAVTVAILAVIGVFLWFRSA